MGWNASGWSLLDLWWRLGAGPYNRMYRRGAPWETGPRPILVELCETGRIAPAQLEPARAIDLGCGSGADSVYLATQGFSVTGVDFSSVAIDKARVAAATLHEGQAVDFVVADLLTLPSEEIPGPFDLLFDGGTLDDFPPAVRPRIADVVTALARPGSVFVMWCFYAHRSDLPLMSFQGPSRWGAPSIEPEELEHLFADHWHSERIDLPDGQPHQACFLMTRR